MAEAENWISALFGFRNSEKSETRERGALLISDMDCEEHPDQPENPVEKANLFSRIFFW